MLVQKENISVTIWIILWDCDKNRQLCSLLGEALLVVIDGISNQVNPTINRDVKHSTEFCWLSAVLLGEKSCK